MEGFRQQGILQLSSQQRLPRSVGSASRRPPARSLQWLGWLTTEWESSSSSLLNRWKKVRLTNFDEFDRDFRNGNKGRSLAAGGHKSGAGTFFCLCRNICTRPPPPPRMTGCKRARCGARQCRHAPFQPRLPVVSAGRRWGNWGFSLICKARWAPG
ncbi:hypothetical protein SKAU_G00213050 [Synaphobranchus kaupii]|uniref:Uncharacterized protein n=1 Tax=Synaphobranchus kaupii TaxID=118154 RepID=A0A9Q1F9A8_SYNKA|nr:hypothetical protein SKAU_G00213050 [Synaphobranchus kaupii]